MITDIIVITIVFIQGYLLWRANHTQLWQYNQLCQQIEELRTTITKLQLNSDINIERDVEDLKSDLTIALENLFKFKKQQSKNKI